MQTWTASVGRQLHPVKRRRVDAAQGGGLDFLGYHWERGYRWPRKKSLEKFQASIGAQTGRTNGQSLKAIILSVNRTLKGWFAYFQHRHYTTFSPLEGWVCGCAASSADGGAGKAEAGIISFGRMLSLPSVGCSPWLRPLLWLVNPLVGKTTDGRAGGGRSACPVRREGGPTWFSLPLSFSGSRRLS